MSNLLHDSFALALLQAIVIISVSRLLGRLARKVGQPMVVAEIVAGILLGPSLLGWLFPRFSAALFPASSMSTLSLLSQVGLVLFMFLIGLELDGRLLRGRGHASVLISHTSILVPFGLGSIVALWLYPQLAPKGVRFSSFTLFMGVAMSITAFPVLARILAERRLLRSPVGAVAVACAAVDDVTAWCLLAFVVSIVRASGVESALKTTGLALAYVLFMLFVLKPFFARLGARATSGDGVPQNVVAATFVLLFLSSCTTELIGIHALFGAFILGAIVPRENGFARALAEKLEDVVVVFLLPLFFAFSGLRTQVGLLDTGRSWLMAGAILVAAVGGKFGGSYVAARLTGIAPREAGAVGILMNTRGLMELIVLNIGLDLGVISPALFAMMVLMALVTTVMTTPLLSLVYPRAELWKDVAEDAARTISEVRERAFTLLACVSNARAWPGMRTIATALAHGSKTRTLALHLDASPDRTSDYLEPDGEATPSPLAAIEAEAKEHALDLQTLSFVSASPAEDICRVAEVKEADLVLVNAHVPLFSQTVLGGTVHDVLADAPADVAVFVDRELARLTRILVPWRGSAHERAALGLAERLRAGTGANVTVLEVVEPGTRGQGDVAVARALADAFGAGANRAGVTHLRVESDEPAEAVVAEARLGYDLVVVGIGRGWGLEHRQFGIFPQRLVLDTEASLLVVRSSPRASRAKSTSGDVEADRGTRPLAAS